MPAKTNLSLRRRISAFCRARVSTVLPPRDLERLEAYLMELIAQSRHPPRKESSFDWQAISRDCNVEFEHLAGASEVIRPALTVMVRDMPNAPRVEEALVSGAPRPSRKDCQAPASPAQDAEKFERPPQGRARPRPRLSEIRDTPWNEPESFAAALALHMHKNGDTPLSLKQAVLKKGESLDRTTISMWRRGVKAPRARENLVVIERIEQLYGLEAGYLKDKLPHPGRAATGRRLKGIGRAEQRRLAWHLPDDFDHRPAREQEQILEWVRRVVITGSTDYRRYQAAAAKTRFALRFPDLVASGRKRACTSPNYKPNEVGDDAEMQQGSRLAPPRLVEEMRALLRFKTSTLTAIGYQRNGVWGDETASQKIEHFALIFGALAAPAESAVRGRGIPLRNLTLAMLVFPALWDWYLQWREQRRGFFTAWEVDLLGVALGLTRKETGWLRQTPSIAEHLAPVPGLISPAEVERAKADWAGTCDAFYTHALQRAKEIERVARVHRDPFEAILPILEAESPLGEYRKITEEIVRLMPNERRYPKAKAEAVRSFLMLRIGLHTGLRQKNLRQLLLCERGGAPTSERALADQKCGELRWSERESGWEVFIPSVAFKNSGSSFFGNKPYRLILPDLGGLYGYIDEYVGRHRRRLMAGAQDPRTFFVKTVKGKSRTAAYDQAKFYEAWRLTVQRYGIFNPYTGRGAIKGLLPHGPHNVRDVLATHILKQTGSYEQASYAIQDTPVMVAKHYGRFLPGDKSALAAQILNRIWEAA